MVLSKLSGFIMCSVLALLPCYSYADNLVNDVGTGISDGATDVGNAVEGAVHKTGQGISEVLSDTNNPVPDATITKNTKELISKLRKENKIDQNTDLSVSTSKGIVSVTGTAEKEQDITTIKDAVKAEAGVKDLKVNIMVRGN